MSHFQSTDSAPLPSGRTAYREEFLSYTHSGVVSRLIDRLSLTQNEAEALFQDVKLWVAAIAHAPTNVTLSIYRNMAILDEGWHEFILFTHDYDQFCQKFFGRFVHHYPIVQDDKAISHSDEVEASLNGNMKNAIKDAISYVHDQFGAATAVRWFHDLPQSFPPIELARRIIATQQRLLDEVS